MTATILGIGIADSLGMPFEQMSPDNPILVNWNGEDFLPSSFHNLKPGQFTDDTQMSVMVAEHLIEHKGFRPSYLADYYRQWLSNSLNLPNDLQSKACRGIGKNTRKALENLARGYPWTSSGLDSEGNGTAMRACPFGVFFHEDIHTVAEFARLDARITHTSINAAEGSAAIAMATWLVRHSYYDNSQPSDKGAFLNTICKGLNNSDIKNRIIELEKCISEKVSLDEILVKFGTKFHVIETVPSALACFMLTDSFESGIVKAIRAGGDTDTTAAIVGGIAGTYYGFSGIPDKFKYKVESFERLFGLDTLLSRNSM